MIKKTMGVVLMLTGVLLGLYLGIWWAFVGGVIDIVESFSGQGVYALGLAIGLVKIMFSSLIGYVSGLVLIVPGYTLFNTNLNSNG